MNLRAASLGAIAFLATGASAPPIETDLGSRIPHPKRAEIPDAPYTDEERGRISIAEFARCVIAQSPQKVIAALQMPIGNDGEALAKVATNDCLGGGTMKFSPGLFRGALFGEMYRRHEAQKPKPWTYPIEPLNFAAQPATDAHPLVRQNFYMLAMADCLHASDPETVAAITLNEPASPKQKAAFAKLLPQLGPCVDQGATAKLSRASLEAAFGEYLYRSLVPHVSVATGKAN